MFAVNRSLDHARDSVPPSMKKPKSSSYAPKPMFQQSTLYSVSASAVCTPPLPCVTAKRLIVLDARIRPEHIAHIQKHDGQHRQQRDCRNFQDLFQASSLLMVLLKRIIPQFPQKCNPREKNKFSILRIILKIVLAFFRALWYAKGRRNRPSAGGSLFIRRIFYVLRQKNDR